MATEQESPVTPATSGRRLDPTHPTRWRAMHERRTRVAFMLRYGVGTCGVTIALMFDAYALTRRGEWNGFFTPRHAAQLELAIAVLAPSLGALGGAALLRLGDRRARQERLKTEFKL